MNLRGISYYLSLSCYPVTFFSFFNILYSSYFDYFLSINSYVITLVISVLVGLILFIFGKSAQKRQSRKLYPDANLT